MRLGRETEGRARRRKSPIVLVVAAAMSIAHCYPIREDDTECQEASALLQECCPGFEATRMRCSTSYVSTGCGSDAAPPRTIPPTMSQGEMECILENSCSSLVSKGICARVVARMVVRDGGTDASPSSDGGPREALCY